VVLDGEIVALMIAASVSSTICYSGEVNRALWLLIFSIPVARTCGANLCWIARPNCVGIIGNGLPPIIYLDHIEGCGVALFEKCCELDLEGIVAKYKHAPYDPEQATWFKIRNRNYSQMVGRE
jgi:hypothetical protein